MVTLWSRGRCCVPLLIDLTDTAWVLCLQPIMEPCLPVSYSHPNQSPSRPWCISMYLFNNTLPTLSLSAFALRSTVHLYSDQGGLQNFFLIFWWTQSWIIELLIYDNHVEYGSASLLIYRMKPIYNFHHWMFMLLLRKDENAGLSFMHLSLSCNIRLFFLVSLEMCQLGPI